MVDPTIPLKCCSRKEDCLHPDGPDLPVMGEAAVMAVVYGASICGTEAIEWRDTWDEAVEAAEALPGALFKTCIVVIAFSERVCTFYYNPHWGWFATGFVNADGVDLIAKYDLYDAVGRKRPVINA